MDEYAYPLVMQVADVYQIRAVGTVVGRVACDEVRYGDRVRVAGDGFALVGKVGGVERYQKTEDVGRRGEEVGILLVTERPKECVPQVRAGMRLCLVEKSAPQPPAVAEPDSEPG